MKIIQQCRQARLGAVLATVGLVAKVSAGLAAAPETSGPSQSSPHSTPAASQRPELALGRSALYDYDPPAPGSYQLPVIKRAGDGEVLGTDGKRHRLRELFEGRISIVSFIYTRCADPKACPYATGVLYQLHQLSKQDPVLARNLHLVTFSFDPDHDTPKVMASFERAYHPDTDGARWTFLTTRSPLDLKPILDAYGQVVDRKKNPRDIFGPFFHQVRVYLIDRQGMVRNIYTFGLLDPRLLITDVRTLLMEEEPGFKKPLSPAEAARLPGKTCTVAFRVKTTARITDITEPGDERPLELRLLDASNGDYESTPDERSGLVVTIPVSALDAFGAARLDELAGRFKGQTVSVTGKVEVEPHRLRHDAEGRQTPRAKILVTDPAQIRVSTEG